MKTHLGFFLLIVSLILTLLVTSSCTENPLNKGSNLPSIFGDETDGNTADGDTADIDETDADASDGDVIDGDETDGDTSDSDITDIDKTDGDTSDGDVIDGDEPDGDTSDGDVIDGDETDGDTTDGDDVDGDSDTLAPVIKSQRLEENSMIGQAVTIHFETDRPAYGSVIVTPEEGESWEVAADETEMVLQHSVWILGLRAETNYVFEFRVVGSGIDVTSSEKMHYTTEPLPADFPIIEATVHDAQAMQPGYRMVGITGFNALSPMQVQAFEPKILIFDEAGEVVWYTKRFEGLEYLATVSFDVSENGETFWFFHAGALTEYDFRGAVIGSVTTADLGIDSLHHGVVKLPNGNFLGIGTEIEEVAYEDASYALVWDVVYEINLSEGVVVNRWSMADYYAIPEELDEWENNDWWDSFYTDRRPTIEMNHANAISYDAVNNAFLLSLPIDGQFIKIDMDNDQVLWKIGEEGHYSMTNSESDLMPSHGHQELGNGHLLSFFNGSFNIFGVGETPSKAVEYDFDFSHPENPVATVVWEYGGEEAFNSPVMGNVRQLQNGNVLICAGSRFKSSPAMHFSPWIVEVTKTANPEIVFEIEIEDPEPGLIGMQFVASRAYVIPGLYQWKQSDR